MPKYVLHYFDARGRAEVARLIFAYAGVPYEDHRIARDAWPALKSKMPFGQLPVLEVDGKMLAQSNAFSKYLAKQFKLTGKDDWEAAQCDALAEGVSDILGKLTPLFVEKDEAKLKELRVQIAKEHIDPFFTRYEGFLSANGTGYFVGNQVTWVDLLLSEVFWMFGERFSDVGKTHTKAAEFVKKIREIPNIKKWVETRPKTEM